MGYFLIILSGIFSVAAQPRPIIKSNFKNQTAPPGLYFLGDSITEGMAYYSDNEAVGDSWQNLVECDAPEILDGRCSNAAPGALYPNKDNVKRLPALHRDVAYSYQVQDLLRARGYNVSSFNIAVSGSRPATWDPSAKGINLANERCFQWTEENECNLDYHQSCIWNHPDECVPSYSNDEESTKLCAAIPNRLACTDYEVIKCEWQNAETCVPYRGYVGQFLHEGQKWDPQLKPEYKKALETSGNYHATSLEKLVVARGILDIPEHFVSVITLGANPMLARWLNPKLGFWNYDIFSRANNSALGYNIAQNPLNCTASEAAAKQCMQKDLDYFSATAHLKNVYRELLSKNDVLVLLYYHACAGFSEQQKPVLKASKTSPCSVKLKNQLASAVDVLNLAIAKAVCEIEEEFGEKSPYKINYVCPGFGYEDNKSITLSCLDLKSNNYSSGIECTYFDDHQFDGGSDKQWVINNDSGIHPNVKGHAVLAGSVVNALCDKLGFYCD